MNIIFLKSTIEKAIKNRKWLKIDYVRKKDMEITTDRIIEPGSLRKDKQDNWIVDAHCFLRNGYRPFQLEGIQKLEVINPTGESVLHPDTTSIKGLTKDQIGKGK